MGMRTATPMSGKKPPNFGNAPLSKRPERLIADRGYDNNPCARGWPDAASSRSFLRIPPTKGPFIRMDGSCGGIAAAGWAFSPLGGAL